MKASNVRVSGVIINEKRFDGAMPLRDLLNVTINPVLGQIVENEQSRAALKKLQNDIQRPFTGAKKRNMYKYAQYFQMILSGGTGITPSIFLYVGRKLEVAKAIGRWILSIANECVPVALDGETQLGALHYLYSLYPNIVPMDMMIPVTIIHNCALNTAQQYFHDRHRFGVDINLSLALLRDHRDPANQLLHRIQRDVPFFKGRIAYRSRTIPRHKGTERSPIVTAVAIRALVRTVAEGSSALGHINEPILTDKEYTTYTKAFVIAVVKKLPELISKYVNNLPDSVWSNSTVWAAIGVVFHAALKTRNLSERATLLAKITAELSSVDFWRGLHWNGICLNYGPNLDRKSTAMSTKHAGHATARALGDKTDAGYQAIRPKSKTKAA